MLDHFNLPVSNLEKSAGFYTEILKPLDMSFLLRDGDAVGFGASCWEFGIVQTDEAIVKIHLAFVAASNKVVDEFYQSALMAGGFDNGKPGLRVEYGASYYAAYVIDPDGHNVEAVCRGERLGS